MAKGKQFSYQPWLNPYSGSGRKVSRDLVPYDVNGLSLWLITPKIGGLPRSAEGGKLTGFRRHCMASVSSGGAGSRGVICPPSLHSPYAWGCARVTCLARQGLKPSPHVYPCCVWSGRAESLQALRWNGVCERSPTLLYVVSRAPAGWHEAPSSRRKEAWPGRNTLCKTTCLGLGGPVGHRAQEASHRPSHPKCWVTRVPPRDSIPTLGLQTPACV